MHVSSKHFLNTCYIPRIVLGTGKKEIIKAWALVIMIMIKIMINIGFPGGTVAKNQPANTGATRNAGSIPGSGRSPGVRTHSSILAWKIPWTEETGRLQSIWLQRVRHAWATEHTHIKSLVYKKYKSNIKEGVTREVM